MPELSILIPSRNEEWLSQTVDDLLANIEGDTEILVGMDGSWAEPGVVDDPRVKVFYVPESIGQRAMQNRLARMSTAKYVMKADAHTAWDKGFDVKMMSKMEDDITMVPVMRNLHVFDWVCDNCGMHTYMGPEPESCRNEICNTATDSGEGHSKLGHHKELVWNAKTNPQSSAYRFNKNLQFKYFPELRDKLPKEGLQESFSLQGSCFMATRENYFKKELCDESWGSWGQQGSEVALKTWLSGGRVLCNFDTWYGHMFRTQEGFSHPYDNPGSSQDRARKISRDIFLNDKWPQASHPLSWLLEKFWFALKDVKDMEARWEEADLVNYKPLPKRDIIYFTAHQKPIKVSKGVQRQLSKIAKSKDLGIVSASLKPMSFGNNTVIPLAPGKLTYFTQIICALRMSKAEIVYMCEDDVLYHPSHFDFIPEDDLFHYNQNWWKIRPSDGFAAHWDANQVSGLIARRKPLLEWYEKKVTGILLKGFNRRYEPGGRDPAMQIPHKSEFPDIDIRLDAALTGHKWSLDDFRDKSSAKNFETSTIDNIPGWSKDELSAIIR